MASNAKFTIHHAGGTTVITKSHIIGSDWVSLGDYQMAPGQGHKVVLSDIANGPVIADAVAFDAQSLATDKATWTLSVGTADQYRVYARWGYFNGAGASNAKYTVYHAGGATEVTKNLNDLPGQWVVLGTFNLAPGQNHRVELSGWANNWIGADAIAIESTTLSPGNQLSWNVPLTIADEYDVYARWAYGAPNSTAVKYTVTHAGGTDTVTVNQQLNSATWFKLGTYDLLPGAGHKVTISDRSEGVTVADAVRVVSSSQGARVARWSGTVGSAGTYQVWGRWTAAPSHTFAATYDITTPGGTQSVTVDQRSGGGQWHLLKTLTLAANDNWKVELSDQTPGEVVADAIAVTPPINLSDKFEWAPTLPAAGEYAVYAKWQAAAGRATDAAYEITHDGGVDQVTVDQTRDGGEWRYLGTWALDPANNPKVALLASLTGTLSADAVRFVAGDAIGGEVVYTHSDQLGTIQKLTDTSGGLAWDRTARPFGETVSISAASGVTQMQRFPGQYADETGLSYNYFRDYDPTLGRYLQSDPIGLLGGVNTYGYVGGNPISYVDPTGEYAQLVWFAVQVTTCTFIHIAAQKYYGCERDWEAALEWSLNCITLTKWVPRWARVGLGTFGRSVGNGIGKWHKPSKPQEPGMASTGSGGGNKGGSGGGSNKPKPEKPGTGGEKKPPKKSPKFEEPTNPPQLPPTDIPPGWRVREMPPAPGYPNGYWRLEKPMPNGGWQGINPSTMKPGRQPDTHIPFPSSEL